MDTKKFIIRNNANREETTFIGRFIEGEFDKGMFNQTIKSIFDLNDADLSVDERLEYSLFVWCISYEVIRLISFDRDPDDIYTISGLSKEEKRILHDIMYHVGCSFSVGKKFDLGFCFL